MTQNILVTGGAGFVGSHACKALSRAGFTPVVFDDFRRGNRWAVKWGPLVEAGLEDRGALVRAMADHDVAAVMHFAAYAYVGESMAHPGMYFDNNVTNSVNLLEAMAETGVSALVISSTCATYGIPDTLPISEKTPLNPINPYGASKVMLEELARWYGETYGVRTISLRYFNAAGSDPDGEIGESHDPETHLVPLAVQAALMPNSPLKIFGTDYDTPDGTAVRDYVHVSDLARAHVAALTRLLAGSNSLICNLGTGHGYSIRDVIAAVAAEVGTPPAFEECPRRAGDPAALVADPSFAEVELGWQAELSDLPTIVRDAVKWQRHLAQGPLRGVDAA